MRRVTRILGVGLTALICLAATSCGGSSPIPTGGGSSGSTTVTPASNVASVVVNGGPVALQYPAVNTLYTTVTVCAPGSTTQCQTIDNIQVDTQSYGLRILASVLTISLPVTTASDGNSLVECTQFVDGYSLGAGGERGPADERREGLFDPGSGHRIVEFHHGARRLFGYRSRGRHRGDIRCQRHRRHRHFPPGLRAVLCGDRHPTATTIPVPRPRATPSPRRLTRQVANPVPFFAVDNNGTMIILPNVAESGAATVTGSLIFGVDTESNNTSGSQTVLAVQGSADLMPGDLPTIFAGQTLADSFIDSGSNALYFNDSSIAPVLEPAISRVFTVPRRPRIYRHDQRLQRRERFRQLHRG